MRRKKFLIISRSSMPPPSINKDATLTVGNKTVTLKIRRRKCEGAERKLHKVVVVVVYFILSRLLFLAFSANLGLLCMPHSGMGPLV